MVSLLKYLTALCFLLPVLYAVHVLFLQLRGRGALPSPPEPKEPTRIAVLICARNEEAVLPALLDSLNRQHYPKARYRTFVVAHNCTDGTAEVARRGGAVCWDYHAEAERQKGYALRYGIQRLRQDYPDCFDTLVLFDADNLSDPDFLKHADAALQGGADAIQGFRMAKNPGDSIPAALSTLLWAQVVFSETLPHSRLKLPVIAGGTGMAIRMDALPEEGWFAETLLEDVDFSIRLALTGKRLCAAPNARFYDEQPERLRDALNQRWRWTVGWNQCLRRSFVPVCRSLPARKEWARKLLGDLLLNPVLCCGELGAVLFAGLLLWGRLSPLWLLSLPVVYLLSLLLPLSLCRRGVLPKGKRLLPTLLYPLWLAVSCLFSIPSLFVRKPKWKPIPHTNRRKLDEILR